MIEKDAKNVTVRIERFNSNGHIGSYIQDFVIEISSNMTVLEGLNFIKSSLDSSLTFRSSCGSGICGSCGMAVNGRNVLACETPLAGTINDDHIIHISPLPERPVIKDLVTDDSEFWQKYVEVKPWTNFAEASSNQENIISPDEVSKYNNAERCMLCGICYSSCPVLLQDNLFIGPHAILKGFLKSSDSRDQNKKSHFINSSSIWDCTTCYKCNEVCPVDLEPGKASIILRNRLMENQKTPHAVGNALTSIYERNNPYNMAHIDRVNWIKERNLPNASHKEVDICYLTCCSSCYDPKLQKSAKAFVDIANIFGISIGTLGDLEKCCGSEVYRLGELELFEYIVKDRLTAIETIKASQIITNSPHCYDVYKNLYGGIDIPVLHSTQFVWELIKNRKGIQFNTINEVVTYHDPCYLGIQNNIFEEPRMILNSIPGIKLIEMEHSRKNSICCGGGGGNIWSDHKTKDRISYIRVKEALNTGASLLVTSCPFCFIELDDAIKILDLESKLKVVDIMQLIVTALM